MRSTIAFTVLILVVLIGYQYFSKPTPPATPAPQTQSQATQSQAAQPAAQTGQPASQQFASAQAQLPGGSAQAASATPTVAAAIVTDTTVENELYKIVFTNRGAHVKQWILKKFI